MEDDSKDVQIPLLDSVPSRKREYLNNNIFDTFLLFWVGKFIEVVFYLLHQIMFKARTTSNLRTR